MIDVLQSKPPIISTLNYPTAMATHLQQFLVCQFEHSCDHACHVIYVYKHHVYKSHDMHKHTDQPLARTYGWNTECRLNLLVDFSIGRVASEGLYSLAPSIHTHNNSTSTLHNMHVQCSVQQHPTEMELTEGKQERPPGWYWTHLWRLHVQQCNVSLHRLLRKVAR